MEIDSPQWEKLLREGAASLGVLLGREQLDAFRIYAHELVRWNRRVNLTAIKDPVGIAVKHFVDSLAPASILPPGSTVLDMGSGAGFPGIPLKIAIPALSITLLDGSRKKVSFQRHLRGLLGIGSLQIVHARAQELARTGARRFDFILARALCDLATLTRLAIPLLTPGGTILSMKGRKVDEEMERLDMSAPDAVSPPRFSVGIRRYRLPLLDVERSMVLVKVEDASSL